VLLSCRAATLLIPLMEIRPYADLKNRIVNPADHVNTFLDVRHGTHHVGLDSGANLISKQRPRGCIFVDGNKLQGIFRWVRFP
jgi:hypothetical protein